MTKALGKVEFTQIISSDGRLYGLDKNGEVWGIIYNMHGSMLGWERVPMVDFTEYKTNKYND